MKKLIYYTIKYSKISILSLFLLIIFIFMFNTEKVNAIGLFASPRTTNEFINRNNFTETNDLYRGYFYPKKWSDTNEWDTVGNLSYWISPDDKMYAHEDFVTPVFDSSTALDLNTVGSKLSQNVYISTQGFYSAFSKNKITWVVHVKGRILTEIDRINYFLQFSLSKGLKFDINANPKQWHAFGQSNAQGLPESMQTSYIQKYTTIVNEETREDIEGTRYSIYRIETQEDLTGTAGRKTGRLDNASDVYYIIETEIDPTVDVNKYELRARASVSSSEFYYANFQFLNDITVANNDYNKYGNICRKSHKSVLATATVSRDKIKLENLPNITPKPFPHVEVTDDLYSFQKNVVLDSRKPNETITGFLNDDHSKILKESDYYVNYNNTLQLPINILANEEVKGVKEYSDSYLSKTITPVDGTGESGEYYVDLRIQGKSYNTEGYGGNYIFVLDASASMSTYRTSPDYGNILRNPFGYVNGKEYSKGEIAAAGLKKTINDLMSKNNMSNPEDPKNNIVAMISFSDQVNYLLPGAGKNIGNTIFTADKGVASNYVDQIWIPWELSRKYNDGYSPEPITEYMIGGATNYQGAVFAVNELLDTLPKIDKNNKRKTHVIFITDGEPTFSYKLERIFRDENGLFYGQSTFERMNDTKVGVTFAKSLKSDFDASNYAFYDKLKSTGTSGWGIERLITSGGYEKINAWNEYNLKGVGNYIWNPLNRITASYPTSKTGFEVDIQNGSNREYTPILSDKYQFIYELEPVGRYVSPDYNGLNPYTAPRGKQDDKKYWNIATLANRNTPDTVRDNGIASKIEIVKLRNRFPDVNYRAIAIYSTKKVDGSKELTEKLQKEENERMEDVLSYFVSSDDNFKLIKPENFDESFIDTINTAPYIRTVRNANLVDPMGAGILFQKNFDMKKASNLQLTDGDYYISSNKSFILDGLLVRYDSSDDSFRVTGSGPNSGINLGEYEYIKIRYKIKLDKSNKLVKTGNFVQTNRQTILYNSDPNILTANALSDQLPRYFPLPSARIDAPLSIEIQKKDTKDELITESKMNGTSFTLKCKENGNFIDVDTDIYSTNDKVLSFDNIEPNKEYYITENVSPKGYIRESRNIMFKFELDATKGYILKSKFEEEIEWKNSDIKNDITGAYLLDVINKPVTIVIKKLDSVTKKSLSGAKFKLYRYTGYGEGFPTDVPGRWLAGVREAEWTQSEEEKEIGHKLEGMQDGWYYLVEESAPEGYRKPATAFLLGYLTGSKLANSNYEFIKSIENIPLESEYPKSGGIGIYLFLITGLGIMSFALYLQLKARKNYRN